MALLAKLISSCFYLGYIPIAPGTLGSLLGLGVYYFVYLNNALYLGAIFLICVLGFWSSGRSEAIFGQKDPKPVIIDEVFGMLITLLFIPPRPFYVVSGFLLYRFFDVLKIYPLKKMEKLPGGIGIMLDDFGAAVYAHITLRCLQFLTNI